MAGRIDNANRFLYAIGGNTGSAANALDTIEVVPLDIFGTMGSWFEQRYRLESPRSDLSVGTHTITLTATDSDSKTGTDVITVTVSRVC